MVFRGFLGGARKIGNKGFWRVFWEILGSQSLAGDRHHKHRWSPDGPRIKQKQKKNQFFDKPWNPSLGGVGGGWEPRTRDPGSYIIYGTVF